MRLCVVVDRVRESVALCGECQFRVKAFAWCHLFKQQSRNDDAGEMFRVNDCFTAQRCGEDPAWQDHGRSPEPPRRGSE